MLSDTIRHLMPHRRSLSSYVILALTPLLSVPPLGAVSPWIQLESGLELAELHASRKAEQGDSIIRVLRIDPKRFELRLLNASEHEDGRPLTARQWCRGKGLLAGINASMYMTDHLTSVSLMVKPGHVNNPELRERDRAVLAFDRKSQDVPLVQIIDRELQDFPALRESYGTLVQSIRMVSLDGRNVWQQQKRKWSTAGIGTDSEGRVLFFHCRSPYSVHDLIDMLLKLPIDLHNAMYVEGGPEAQLYVRNGSQDLEFVGCYETGFWERDDCGPAHPVPNIIGVAPRQEP
jgi:uncharacterized protein YigE (DUF2233 family)